MVVVSVLVTVVVIKTTSKAGSDKLVTVRVKSWPRPPLLTTAAMNVVTSAALAFSKAA